MLDNQFGSIKKSFQKSLNIPRHKHLHDDIYSEIRGRISLNAMQLIGKQIERAEKLPPYKGENCNCKIKLTHGLPCAHDIVLYRFMGKPIPQNAIHVHWSKLSTQVPKCTDEGVQPDKAAHLFEILNEMDHSSRDVMIDRFIDMSDPSRCTVRPPSYNIEQKGRPRRKDEQNNDRRPFFSFSTTETGVPHIPKSQGRNMRDPLIQKFPQRYQRYISHCVDVKADGHCGFRVIAALLHGSEDQWAQVRLDLMQEMLQNWDMYDNLYFHEDWASRILRRLEYFEPSAPELFWYDVAPMGVVLASAYNVVVHTFDWEATACHTQLPLRSQPVPVTQRQHIAIGRINRNHFVQVFLYPNYPVPPILKWKLSGESDGWAHYYQARIQLWYDVMQMDPPGQHFGGNLD